MNCIIANHQVILLCSHALKCYDKRLMDHGTRVAYLAEKIYYKLGMNVEIDVEKLFLLSLFHDIGAYKTEEIDRMITFETVDVDAHSVYGHLFLKYLSPLSQYSEAILYHHSSAEMLKDVEPSIAAYAQLIHIADRVDIGIICGFRGDDLIENVNSTDYFDNEYVVALKKVIEEDNVWDEFENHIKDWAFTKSMSLNLDSEEVDCYLKMIIYSMDFKSSVTMLHSVNTTTIAVFLAKYLGFDEKEIVRISYAALVHDIGKIAIPHYILESTEKLKKEELNIMRGHSELTKSMLQGVFEQQVIDYASSHHEKLNGTGYPLGLSDDQLSQPMRIVAIADIISALLSNRSYKSSYSWEKTIVILEDMASQFLIDEEIVKIVIAQKDRILKALEVTAKPLMDKYELIHNEFKDLISRENL